MSVQVLIATMNQTDHSLLKKMNIQSDAIVSNQCDFNKIEEFTYNGYNIKFISFAEKGVGLNRNNALMRADADYCLFADDDLVYVDGYPQIVENEFKKHPNADVLIFNLIEQERKKSTISKEFKVNWFNFMRFGTSRIAIRTKSIHFNGIFFNLYFGGGAKYSFGEDTLFLASCLKKKLKIIAVPVYIARLTNERPSTWFRGYTDQYFYDKGVLFYQISKRYCKFLCLQDVIRHRKLYSNGGMWDNFKIMAYAINDIRHGKLR
ncbi:hypothetical protein CSTERLE_00680 [Thermoclostridium stercorarium subsp. leptospartum DSM 9219]|uniref:Glycosyltransferase 2-like domain-containing protein n=1 Tax=Thermoclostridium stercorarium subsp. leptospartum DSM 9219 TaxID=1346611 RepID=A0A1B1YHH4_THEST|nr:glycosyltransferase family A protein [Thermoclostridium stercorarium]ANX00209.1 hypothetical protein CSTERLE_00680 [Thermoclostridium stercorarium subsp. leptospartum DSM 9219]